MTRATQPVVWVASLVLEDDVESVDDACRVGFRNSQQSSGGYR
jgi:hypothetical protein